MQKDEHLILPQLIGNCLIITTEIKTRTDKIEISFRSSMKRVNNFVASIEEIRVKH